MGISGCCALVDVAPESGRLVIKGITQDGNKFRPSDWAQRLASAAGDCNGDGRFRLNPQVQVAMVDGAPALVVDVDLARSNPHLYKFLLDFSCRNNLQLSE